MIIQIWKNNLQFVTTITSTIHVAYVAIILLSEIREKLGYQQLYLVIAKSIPPVKEIAFHSQHTLGKGRNVGCPYEMLMENSDPCSLIT